MNTKLILLLILNFAFLLDVHAGSATWNLSPTSSDWNTAANWTPATVPNDPSDTATFDLSNTTSLRFSADTNLAAIVFNPDASSYSIATAFNLTLGGAGIVNNSGVAQNFTSLGDVGKIHFRNSATAGDANFTTHGDSGVITEVAFYDTASAANATFVNQGGNLPGVTLFFDASTAGNATISNFAGNPNGAAAVFMGGASAGSATITCEGEGPGNAGVQFRAHSTAGQATVIANGGPPHQAGQYIDFLARSKAGRATVIANGATRAGGPGGIIYFGDISDAENATLIANNGTNGGQAGGIAFSGASQGSSARVELSPGTILDISSHDSPGISLGSIEGKGRVTLGANNLTVGENNLETSFSGTIGDGDIEGGSLTKQGTATLSLSGANTYTGGTIVSAGTLSVGSIVGSATGSGAVSVQEGRLSGSGLIAGAVTVGTATGVTATISPGFNPLTPGTLNLESNIVLKSDAVFQFNFQSDAGTAGIVAANGVTIDPNAVLVLHDSGNSALRRGTSFFVISNTAVTPISGAFSNLPDGGTITVGSNTFQANYEAGDGNDLTLTVL